jgi:hypothetical protein
LYPWALFALSEPAGNTNAAGLFNEKQPHSQPMHE